ncbi:MAG: amidohydrolase, partial [Clostridiales bacterium]|nr:amidohydrolase [Clostridiales bacterium]
MIIDANLYWFPERVFEDEKALNTFLSEIPRNYGTNGYLKVNDNGTRQIVIEKPTGYQSLNYVQGDYKLE